MEANHPPARLPYLREIAAELGADGWYDVVKDEGEDDHWHRG